jgi:quercetin dioxygenase-like cupin family protein
MYFTRFLALVVTLLVAPISTAVYASPPVMQVVNPAMLQWHIAKDMPPGATVAILSGNPQGTGHFIARLKLPANYIVPAHSHSINEFDTVISGTYYLGAGKVADANQGTAMHTGDFVMIPANSRHYGYTREGATLEIRADGPWGMKYESNG